MLEKTHISIYESHIYIGVYISLWVTLSPPVEIFWRLAQSGTHLARIDEPIRNRFHDPLANYMQTAAD